MIHEGHRHRMRERFMKDGLDGFAPHEALELLLFFAIPQKNVNPLAHRLLDAFGSFHGVMEASPEQLMRVEGIGENAAALISLMVPLGRYYHQSAAMDKPRLTNRRQAEGYCRNLLTGLRDEHFYCVLLDAQSQVLGNALIAKGSISQVPAYPRRVVEAVLRLNAHSVVLCHNHPGGTMAPSQDDLNATSKIVEVLQGIDVNVLDHLIIGSQGVCSLSREGYLNGLCGQSLLKASEKHGGVPASPREWKGKEE